MLGGDFNSRLRKKYTDYIISDTNDHFPVDQDLKIMIISGITKIRMRIHIENYLSDLCITDSLTILNGRTIGDLTGKFTCFAYKGNSTVDLVIAPNTVEQKVNYFKILPVTEWSDHCQLVTELSIKTRNHNKNC